MWKSLCLNWGFGQPDAKVMVDWMLFDLLYIAVKRTRFTTEEPNDQFLSVQDRLALYWNPCLYLNKHTKEAGCCCQRSVMTPCGFCCHKPPIGLSHMCMYLQQREEKNTFVDVVHEEWPASAAFLSLLQQNRAASKANTEVKKSTVTCIFIWFTHTQSKRYHSMAVLRTVRKAAQSPFHQLKNPQIILVAGVCIS